VQNKYQVSISYNGDWLYGKQKRIASIAPAASLIDI